MWHHQFVTGSLFCLIFDLRDFQDQVQQSPFVHGAVRLAAVHGLELFPRLLLMCDSAQDRAGGCDASPSLVARP